ncbi:hypothetical protein Hsar01_03399 [Haloferula sargassicola]|uniref:Sulfotransferase domain-containing protein n=1 Tax=Haloferula sargassicola TaxID=490096 RepID=A0ABP9UWB9_9BACT
MPRPSIFIVGAPKCGTTALYHCLRQHPGLYFPLSEDPARYWLCKEPGHFAGDLRMVEWLRIVGESDYLSLFADAAGDQRCGEATATYLFSHEAPLRIRNFTGGEARIIIMVRPPAEWMRSWHHDLLRYGYENCSDFEKALSLGERRDVGRSLPRRAAFAGCMNYRKLARFSNYIEHWLEVFGRERVFIGWQPDFQQDPEVFVSRLLDFLGLDPAEIPAAGRRNDSSILPGTHLIDLWFGRMMARLPGGEKVARVFRKEVGHAYKEFVSSFFHPLSDRTIPEPLASRLKEEFADEEARLRQLAGEGSDAWRQAPRWHSAWRGGARQPQVSDEALALGADIGLRQPQEVGGVDGEDHAAGELRGVEQAAVAGDLDARPEQ